jgi:capsular exopolysaccharide synthesis family protein
MNIDLMKLIRARWITIAVTTLVSLLAAVVFSLMTTPMYEASTRLYVSTSAGSSATDLYQANRLSQDRVLSYTELLKGETLAQRTIDKLQLDETATGLQSRVTATAKRSTVLISVEVLDASPVRARDIANALSDEFVVMVRELETPRPGAQPDARVVVEQRASIPQAPVIPRTSRNIAAGLALGALLGTGLALVRDLLDNTTKDREVVESITGAGLVGIIPADKEIRNKPAISFDRDNSAIAEAFRKLRTNLQFLEVDNPPRVIVVTSSAPAEGKSTTAINIALALAESDHSVVLVDGDMRRPSLHKYLDLVGAVGFSTVLSGGASLSEVLQDTKYPRLTVLAAGTSPPNPSELLGSMAAKRLLSELREKFDYVIVDSAPLLAVTDAAILATKADGALIITRFGKTKRDQLAHTARTVEDVGAKLLGVIMTMMPIRSGGYYGRYSYYYGYGADTSDRSTMEVPARDEDAVAQISEDRAGRTAKKPAE